ncbi:cation:proton antiporter [Lutibacter sp. B2]|nr:cation:proton antiporter [Lutibacter sp. B2]
MINKCLIISAVCLSITIILCMIRAVKGPSNLDRLVAINVINTKIIVLIAIVSFVLGETYFIDVVLVYALISFIASVIIADYIQKTGGKES